jgi:hypothetical protein
MDERKNNELTHGLGKERKKNHPDAMFWKRLNA